MTHADTRTWPSAPQTPVTEHPRNLTPPCTPSGPHTDHHPTYPELERMGYPTPISTDPKPNITRRAFETSITPTAEEALSWMMISPRAYSNRYQRSGSPSSGHGELGTGAWSTVYQATEISETSPSALFTPPSSPARGSGTPTRGRVLAVKAPSRKDAHNILYQEARILTYLLSCRLASNYIVPFHGYDATTHSLIMDAVPLNLDVHAKSCLKKARDNFSTRTMFDPVCGPQEWRSLASQLIEGLMFLHTNHCVHGDIKPSNILLRPNDNGSSEMYTSFYCDFSSARIINELTGKDTNQDQQLSALTPDFASPELFTSLHSTNAVATTASDVYALAVTLVVAAIGTSPFAGASMEVMKLSMAREGRVLDFARQADQGTRVMKGKMVERCLKDALEKDVEKRCTAEAWKRHVQAIFEELS
ncbi:MAG: hypothetical protein Q9166_002945 [cf. Caloplaca sp. 2 TL-2023]